MPESQHPLIWSPGSCSPPSAHRKASPDPSLHTQGRVLRQTSWGRGQNKTIGQRADPQTSLLVSAQTLTTSLLMAGTKRLNSEKKMKR